MFRMGPFARKGVTNNSSRNAGAGTVTIFGQYSALTRRWRENGEVERWIVDSKDGDLLAWSTRVSKVGNYIRNAPSRLELIRFGAVTHRVDKNGQAKSTWMWLVMDSSFLMMRSLWTFFVATRPTHKLRLWSVTIVSALYQPPNKQLDLAPLAASSLAKIGLALLNGQKKSSHIMFSYECHTFVIECHRMTKWKDAKE